MKKNGFTIIELLVGIVVFSLAIIIAVELLMVGLKSQRKSIAIQNVQDNARYLLGFMSKEIRMSEINTNDSATPEGTLTLNITHPVNGNITYTFTGAPDWQIKRRFWDADAIPPVYKEGPISSPEVYVDGRFYVDGKTLNDYQQPRVTIIMKVRTTGTKAEEQATINLETTLSQRILD